MNFMPKTNICGPGPPKKQDTTAEKSEEFECYNDILGHSSSCTGSDRLVTGPSCTALRTAVSALYSVDDFILEKIGSGFFSEVFKVTHKTSGEIMVLKMNQLRSNRPNMLREVQLLNKLSHSNILKFMGVCVKEGQLHALTEYIPDGSLEQLIQNKNEYLSPTSKTKLALGIAKGMKYVHSKGIFHRDLTSKNVLVRRYPCGDVDAVVGDFGLAAKIPEKSGKTRLDTVGSPYWMSPECLNGLFYDESSDVFSYGIILCELIARIEADPDILPRTDAFGLDYIAFVDLCPDDTVPDFLRIAFLCSNYEAKHRLTFIDVVKKLTLMLDKKNSEEVLQEQEINNSPYSTVSSSLQFNKRKSIDSTLHHRCNENCSQNSKTIKHSTSELQRQHMLAANNPYPNINYRRSYSSENITVPLIPADKARCHPLNRFNNKSQQAISEVEIKSILSSALRKIAETMVLKDPKYKPRPKENTKLNPFTALSQLRGVKKIIGAQLQNGPNDLFSSCFEMSSSFLKNLKDHNHKTKKRTTNEPKSLPSSPLVKRRDFIVNLPYDSISLMNVDSSKCYQKRYFDMLQNHPLYRNGKKEETECCSSDKVEALNESKELSIIVSANPSSSKFLNINYDMNNFLKSYETPRLITRRGSTESGFFSCFNEDFCDKTRDIDNAGSYFCTCCILSSTQVNENSIRQPDDSSNDSTSASLRSFDEFEFADLYSQKWCCRHHRIDINTNSVDIDIINRLTLDTEINSIIQKHQLSNQLFHCKNRTSSIFSDSTDSLADSLWDDNSIPNTRSAQIAKIVEYFERKGSNYSATNISMSNIRPSSTNHFLPSSNYHHQHKQLTDFFVDLRRDFHDANKDDNDSSELKLKRDHDGINLDFSEKKTQNFYKICEGSVKSKLPLFDKLQQTNKKFAGK